MSFYIVPNAVFRFRKALEKAARKGRYQVRVYGSQGQWFLGIQRGFSIVQVRSGFITQSSAMLAGLRLYGYKPSLYRSRKVA